MHFIEQNVGGFPIGRRAVKRPAEHLVGIPPGKIEDRLCQPPQLRQLIELDAEDAVRRDAAFEQVLDDLVEQRRLTDLPRSAQHGHLGHALLDPSPHGLEGPAPEFR